jgi:hypothetical protein
MSGVCDEQSGEEVREALKNEFFLLKLCNL